MPILPPIGLRLVNISWLTVLISAAEQDHDSVTMFAEIHSVPRAKKQPQFVDAFPHGCPVAKVAVHQARHPCEDTLPPYPITQAVEPCRKRFLALGICIHNYPLWSCFIGPVGGSFIIEVRTLVRKHIKNNPLFPQCLDCGRKLDFIQLKVFQSC